jgi:hypothetical protein
MDNAYKTAINKKVLQDMLDEAREDLKNLKKTRKTKRTINTLTILYTRGIIRPNVYPAARRRYHWELKTNNQPFLPIGDPGDLAIKPDEYAGKVRLHYNHNNKQVISNEIDLSNCVRKQSAAAKRKQWRFEKTDSEFIARCKGVAGRILRLTQPKVLNNPVVNATRFSMRIFQDRVSKLPEHLDLMPVEIISLCEHKLRRSGTSAKDQQYIKMVEFCEPTVHLNPAGRRKKLKSIAAGKDLQLVLNDPSGESDSDSSSSSEESSESDTTSDSSSEEEEEEDQGPKSPDDMNRAELRDERDRLGLTNDDLRLLLNGRSDINLSRSDDIRDALNIYLGPQGPELLQSLKEEGASSDASSSGSLSTGSLSTDEEPDTSGDENVTATGQYIETSDSESEDDVTDTSEEQTPKSLDDMNHNELRAEQSRQGVTNDQLKTLLHPRKINLSKSDDLRDALKIYEARPDELLKAVSDKSDSESDLVESSSDDDSDSGGEKIDSDNVSDNVSDEESSDEESSDDEDLHSSIKTVDGATVEQMQKASEGLTFEKGGLNLKVVEKILRENGITLRKRGSFRSPKGFAKWARNRLGELLENIDSIPQAFESESDIQSDSGTDAARLANLKGTGPGDLSRMLENMSDDWASSEDELNAVADTTSSLEFAESSASEMKTSSGLEFAESSAIETDSGKEMSDGLEFAESSDVKTSSGLEFAESSAVETDSGKEMSSGLGWAESSDYD